MERDPTQLSTPTDPKREPQGLPIACTPSALPREQRTTHLALSTQVIVHWPRRGSTIEGGFLFEYQGDEELFVTVARWAAAEHRCCPWANYAVAMLPFGGGGGTIQLRVTASPEGKAFLATAYQYLAELDGASPPASIMDTEGTLTHATLLQRLKGVCGC